MPDLTVADNICITDPPRRFGLIDQRAQRRRAEGCWRGSAARTSTRSSRCATCSLSRRQMVEIAKALGAQPQDADPRRGDLGADRGRRREGLRDPPRLRDEGLAILYISHRMHEIEALADDCSVFRNGRHIETFAKAARRTDDADRRDDDRPRRTRRSSRPSPQRGRGAAQCSRSRDLSWAEQLHDISLQRRPRRDRRARRARRPGPARAAAGAVRRAARRRAARSGSTAGRCASPARARPSRAGYDMALIPEDRKTEGLMLPMSVREN